MQSLNKTTTFYTRGLRVTVYYFQVSMVKILTALLRIRELQTLDPPIQHEMSKTIKNLLHLNFLVYYEIEKSYPIPKYMINVIRGKGLDHRVDLRDMLISSIRGSTKFLKIDPEKLRVRLYLEGKTPRITISVGTRGVPLHNSELAMLDRQLSRSINSVKRQYKQYNSK